VIYHENGRVIPGKTKNAPRHRRDIAILLPNAVNLRAKDPVINGNPFEIPYPLRFP
jgi:hypothetical protein